DLPDFISDFLGVYLEKKGRFETFARYIDTEGKEDIKAISDKYREIPDFHDDKDYYFDWGASELFSLVGKGVGECSAGLFDLIELDLKSIKDRQAELASAQDPAAAGEILYQMTLSAARMLLVTRGVEARSDKEVFDNFIKHFLETNLIEKRFLPLLKQAKGRAVEGLPTMSRDVHELAEAVGNLYEGMDDSLKFQQEKEEGTIKAESVATTPAKPEQPVAQFKDLRGVPCPMNFVKTKLELSKIQKGQFLKIFLDDGEPIDNVPHSVAEEGHRVAEVTKVEDYWSVLIEK
ncbi:MAG: sulfurtransferase TusA family protein, partial [Syntrophales bacterium LBB04]|nr:sulfurtransferase TusA family protein [Syntrophales bacterium LBB04]